MSVSLYVGLAVIAAIVVLALVGAIHFDFSVGVGR